jgi:hypothetical protein
MNDDNDRSTIEDLDFVVVVSILWSFPYSTVSALGPTKKKKSRKNLECEQRSVFDCGRLLQALARSNEKKKKSKNLECEQPAAADFCEHSLGPTTKKKVKKSCIKMYPSRSSCIELPVLCA